MHVIIDQEMNGFREYNNIVNFAKTWDWSGNANMLSGYFHDSNVSGQLNKNQYIMYGVVLVTLGCEFADSTALASYLLAGKMFQAIRSS